MTDPTGKRVTVLRSFLVLTTVVSAGVLGGCEPQTIDNRPAPISQADRIALLVPENAIVNLDGEPGADGLIAQVMLLKDQGKGPKSVLVNGEVDILIYEGPKPNKISADTKPFFSWTFTSKQLAERVIRQYSTLWGYALRLRWDKAPQSSKVWLIARYRPPSGQAIFSSPAEQLVPADGANP